MAHAFAKTAFGAPSEYSVYIYHRHENQCEGQNDWEMRTSTPDLNAALDEAESLHNSQSFRKVEVKQRVVNPKTRQVRDYTLKIFSADEKQKRNVPIFYAGGAVVAVASALWLARYIWN